MKKQDEKKLRNKILKELGFRLGGDYFALENIENHPDLEIQDISEEELNAILNVSIKESEKLFIDLILNHLNCKDYHEFEGKKATCLDIILDKLEYKK